MLITSGRIADASRIFFYEEQSILNIRIFQIFFCNYAAVRKKVLIVTIFGLELIHNFVSSLLIKLQIFKKRFVFCNMLGLGVHCLTLYYEFGIL